MILEFVFETKNVSGKDQLVEFGPFTECGCPMLVLVHMDLGGKWDRHHYRIDMGKDWAKEVSLGPGETDSRSLRLYYDSDQSRDALGKKSRFMARKESRSYDPPGVESSVLVCPTILGESGEIVMGSSGDTDRKNTYQDPPTEDDPASGAPAPKKDD